LAENHFVQHVAMGEVHVLRLANPPVNTLRTEIRAGLYDGMKAARAAGAMSHGPLPQGVFLQRLGFMTRAAVLARLDPRRAQAQLAAAHRLTAPEAMGRLFKALALCDSRLPVPAGFETA
jgi:hypothetical protein